MARKFESFVNYTFNRLTEAKKSTKEIANDFEMAKQSLEELIRNKFLAVSSQINKSFGSSVKIDKNLKTKIADSLSAIASRLRSLGNEQTTATPPPNDVVDHYVNKIGQIIKETNLVLEDDSPVKVKNVSDYLNSAAEEIIQSVDQVLQSLQRDTITASLATIGTGVKNIGTDVGSIKQSMTVPSLSSTEQDNIKDALIQIGNAVGAEKRKFGSGLKPRVDIKIYGKKGGQAIGFDPTDILSVKQAIGKIQNPRDVKIKINNKDYQFDLTNSSAIADLRTIIDGIMGEQE